MYGDIPRNILVHATPSSPNLTAVGMIPLLTLLPRHGQHLDRRERGGLSSFLYRWNQS